MTLVPPAVAMPDQRLAEAAARAIAGKAMPLGAMGRIEALAVQLAVVRGTLAPAPPRAAAVVFAGDHGLVAEGVSAYPSAITAEVAKLVAAGRAGISVCAAAAGVERVLLVDAGLLEPLPAETMHLSRRMGAGTASSLRGPAMSQETCLAAFEAGAGIARSLAADGIDVICLGEIGIGNSSAAALVSHALTGAPLAALVGPGAGQPEGGLARKRRVLEAVRARAPTTGPAAALAEFAGFEMVMLAGAATGAAAGRMLVVVDGFIATAAILAATRVAPALGHYLVFAHASAEPGHRIVLEHLAARPLLDLSMRLGEGTGAVLAVPLIRAAAGLLTGLADLPVERPT